MKMTNQPHSFGKEEREYYVSTDDGSTDDDLPLVVEPPKREPPQEVPGKVTTAQAATPVTCDE
jgi:hypothetical protein